MNIAQCDRCGLTDLDSGGSPPDTYQDKYLLVCECCLEDLYRLEYRFENAGGD